MIPLQSFLRKASSHIEQEANRIHGYRYQYPPSGTP